MLRFSGEVGQAVHRGDGTRIGRLRDLTVDLDDEVPVVRRIVVQSRRRELELVDWPGVASFERTAVQLRDGADLHTARASIAEPLPLGPSELLLGRDVLDAQVVDLDGSRVARVADILLVRLPDERLLVAAADVGFGAVCARLGLRRIADRLPEEAVAWDALHLTSARGHLVQLRTTKAAMHRLDSRELASLLTALPVSSAAEVLATVHGPRAARALTGSETELAATLLAELGPAADPILDTLPEPEAGRLRRLRGRARPRRYLRHRRRRPRIGRRTDPSAPDAAGR